jgi:protein associated with RNAse G/E
MATGQRELAPERWQETELLLWKPPTAWFSINAFYTAAGMRNWYVNFEHPTRRTPDGFDTFDLAVDLVVAPDLVGRTWKDEDEYAHVRRLGIVTDTEHQAVDAARDQVLAMIEERSGPFADAAWTSWRRDPAWPAPRLPQPAPATARVAPRGG